MLMYLYEAVINIYITNKEKKRREQKRMQMKKILRLVASCTFIACLTLYGDIGTTPVNAKEPIRVGSQGAKTIEDAIENANEGDTIIVPAGVYKEQISVETDGITIIGEDGAVLEGSKITPKSSDDSMIYICASDVTIDNLEIKGFTLNKPSGSVCPKGICVDEGSENITIQNCEIHDMGCMYSKKSDDYNAHGILVDGSLKEPTKNVTITNCEVYGLRLGNSEAVVVNGNVEGFEISGNTVHDCDNIGIDAIGFEKTTKDNRDRARAGKICNNTVYNISSKDNVTYDEACADGIYIDGGTDIDVFDNYVENCDLGIEIATEHKGVMVEDIRVNNNVVINGGLAGISIGGYDTKKTGGAKNCVITNNTIYNTKGACFLVQYACDSSNKFKNNLVIAEGSADPYEEAFKDKSRGNDVSDNLSNIEFDGAKKGAKKIDVEFTSANRNEGTATVKTYTDISGYGSTNTVLKNR